MARCTGSLLKFIYTAIFFFQAEDGIRDKLVTGVQTVCSSDLAGPNGRRITGGVNVAQLGFRGDVVALIFPVDGPAITEKMLGGTDHVSRCLQSLDELRRRGDRKSVV